MAKKILVRNVLAVMGATVICLSLSGCIPFKQQFIEETENPLKAKGRVTTTGVHQLFDEDSFEVVDLPNLLDPDNKRGDKDTAPAALAESDSQKAAEEERIRLEKAFNAFYTYPDREQRRNRIQDRLLAASEQRCNLYKNYLKRVETYQSSTLGILTTVLGGAGAIATGTINTRAFAGLAGISSGMGAELKAGFFANLASQVITPGIELRREKILGEINQKRSQGVRQYTVEAALRDVTRYHGACSLIAGLEEAGVATKTFSNPGLDSINQTLLKLRESNTLMADTRSPISLSEYLRTYRTFQQIDVSTTLPPLTLSENVPSDFLNNVIADIEALFVDVNGKAKAQRDDNQKKTTDEAKRIKAYLDQLLGPQGQLEELRIRVIEQLNKLQNLFADAGLQLSTLSVRFNSESGENRITTQGKLDEKQAEYQKNLQVPVKIFYDGVTYQLGNIASGIQQNNASAVQSAIAAASSISIPPLSGVSALP